MSLPTGQRRILDQIEVGLVASDPTLASLFVIFERLTRDEVMPWAETVRVRPVRDRVARARSRVRRLANRPVSRMRALLLVPAALAAMSCALTLAAVSSGGHRGAPGGRAPAAKQTVVQDRPCRLAMLRVRMPVFSC